MADQRRGGISWTEETWNPIRGCRRVNQDCINCYAERIAASRLANPGQPYHGLALMTADGPRWTGDIQLDEQTLQKPLHWQRPRLVFVNAMSDLFYEKLTDAQIDRVVLVMALTRRHTFQVLTKRPARMQTYLSDRRLPERLGQIFMDGWPIEPHLADHAVIEWPRPDVPALVRWPLPNVWWGASMGHQQAVDDFMPHLLACGPHAAVLWVSAEPLTERVTFHPPADLGYRLLSKWYSSTGFDSTGSQPERTRRPDLWPRIDWMVGGGESGPNARACPLSAARQLRDECRKADVPFHWKQNGEYDLVIGKRIGRIKAGRLLDGKLWDEWPVIMQTSAGRITGTGGAGIPDQTR